MKKELALHIAQDFNVKSVATVQELEQHDMIYIYHHLRTGSKVQLRADGTNVKGDIRYKVMYTGFLLGYVTLGGYFKSYYESSPVLNGTITSLQRKKFLPVTAMDIEVDIVQMKKAS